MYALARESREMTVDERCVVARAAMSPRWTPQDKTKREETLEYIDTFDYDYGFANRIKSIGEGGG